MRNFQPHINPVYPPNNLLIFEEWFWMNFKGCNSDREMLPVFFTSYWVNNDYGNDKEARRELNDFLGTLDKSKKYFTIIQYDDGSMIDWRLFGLDVLEFNMSKQNGIMLPLICMPHPYRFAPIKKYLVNFVGSRTHPIRNVLESFKGREGWYISYEPHNIEDYCRIMSESVFTLCPRGYGANSFRICEAMQHGSIPVYISDEFIDAFHIPFYEYGVQVGTNALFSLPNRIEKLSDTEIKAYQDWGKQAYEEYYTYQGCYKNIIRELETEYNSRKAQATITETTGNLKQSEDN